MPALQGNEELPVIEAFRSSLRGGNTGDPEALREFLVEALKDRFSMDDDDAVVVASIVVDQFESDEEVNDETLAPEVRSIFYTLEAKKLLSFRREEYSIETGERRRAFFWRVRDDELVKIAKLAGELPDNANVYDELPGSAWSRSAHGAS